MSTVNDFLRKASDPEYPFHYYPTQTAFIAGVSYISTSVFTTLPPFHGMIFMTLARIINFFTNELFARITYKYHSRHIVTMIGKAVNILTSALLASAICAICRIRLSIREVCRIAAVTLLTIYVVKWIATQFFGEYKKAPPDIFVL